MKSSGSVVLLCDVKITRYCDSIAVMQLEALKIKGGNRGNIVGVYMVIWVGLGFIRAPLIHRSLVRALACA